MASTCEHSRKFKYNECVTYIINKYSLVYSFDTKLFKNNKLILGSYMTKMTY